MRDKNIMGKEQAFKVAIISEFNCQTFEDFVSALSEKMEHLSKVADHITIYGHDAYNKWFRFHVKSFRYQPLNNTIILTIYYKWETSSDKQSNWHEEDLVIFSTTYAGYKRDADRIYRKNKPHDDAVDALSYTVAPARRNGKYLTSRIEAAIREKVRKEHDISVGLFKDTFSFEYMDSTFNAYVKSIDCVTEEDPLPFAPNLRQIVLRDLVVSICDTKGDGTEIDIPIKWIAFWTNYFAVRKGGPNPDVITGVHISRDRPNYDLEPPKTPVTFSAYPAFEQWKKKNPFAYEIIFTLISYYGKKHGRDAKSEMYFIKQNFRDRIIGNVIGTDGVGMHCPKVNHFKIKDIYIGSEYVRIELDDITYTDATGTTHKIDCTYTASVMKVEYRIVQEICSEVDAAYNEKRRLAKETDYDDKPTYKKPGITYKHVSTAKPGSTETQKTIERILKNSFYGMNAISPLDGKPYINNEKYLASTIESAIRKKLIDENDISVGDFEGVKDAFSFECYGTKFKAYIKSIDYVTAEGHPGATWKLIKLNDLIVSTDDNQGTELDIRIDSVACYGSHFDLRRGGLTDAITGVHVSRVKREWFDYLNRKHIRLGKTAVHHLEPITPVSYNLADVEFCTDLYNHLNEKENKEMKENENKIIINHNAVIAIDGKYKSVVKLREGEKWNTKLGVVMVVAKFTRRDLYKLLRTIKNPGNETIDRIADLIQMGSGNGGIRAFKWYQDAIKVKRPAAGKQVSIDITYEEA